MSGEVSRWRLWYDDGSTVEGATQEEWDAAPCDGVIYGMMFFSDGTAAHLSGMDLYWSRDFGDGAVFAHDSDRDGLLRRLRFVKWGRWTTLAKHDKAMSDAAKRAEEWYRSIFPEAKPSGGCEGCP
jgi:hypothetical protein